MLFPKLEHPSFADYFYESNLTGQKLLAPFAIEPCMGCKQPVKELLSEVQKRIGEKGWALVFMDKGSYYSNAYATVIAREADLLSLEKLLLRMQMKMLTFEQLLKVAK